MVQSTGKAFKNKILLHNSVVLGQRLKFDAFNDDVLKHFTFKRKFKRMIENVYLDFDIRFVFLQKRASEWVNFVTRKSHNRAVASNVCKRTSFAQQQLAPNTAYSRTSIMCVVLRKA